MKKSTVTTTKSTNNNLESFSKKKFQKMNDVEKRDYLEAGATDFSKRFLLTLKKLANE